MKKGIFFVQVSSILLYKILRRQMVQMLIIEKKKKRKRKERKRKELGYKFSDFIQKMFYFSDTVHDICIIITFYIDLNPQPTGHMHPSMPTSVVLLLTFKIFSSPFDVDWEEVPLQPQMKLVLQCSEDLKSKFLTCYILDFYKNHMLPPGNSSNLITL